MDNIKINLSRMLCHHIEFEVVTKKWYQLKSKIITVTVWYTLSKLYDYTPKELPINFPFDTLKDIDELINWLDINKIEVTKVKKRGGKNFSIR